MAHSVPWLSKMSKSLYFRRFSGVFLWDGCETVLLVLLILMLLGAWPTWPHSRIWGYYPSGGLGVLLAILIVLLLLGRI